MGLVYLGHDLLLDRPVAIKFIAGADPDQRRTQRFLVEGRAVARLIHPNVVSTFRVGDVEGRPFMVSEYVSGRSLDQLDRPMPWRRVVEIGIGVARGLAAAHRAGILHRDIKPANVMLTGDGAVKLIDFGLAKLVEPAEPRPMDRPTPPSGYTVPTVTDDPATDDSSPGATALPDATLSRSGALVGTPRYMAPERLAGEVATPQSDVFALACVLRELCWGGPPSQPPPRDQAAPPELAAIIERSLARDPAERPASAEALLQALERLADDTSATVEIPAGNPYRGLAAFEAADRALFLGRSSEVRAIVERLRSDPVVVVAGDSGVGKSSLCRAGVLPWLTEAGLDAGGKTVAVALTAGRDPVLRLAQAVGELTGEAREAIRIQLADEPTEVLRSIARAADGKTVVVFVDQIEELFTQAPADQAEVFARALAQLAGSGFRLRVLATVRGDFLARLAALPGLGPEVARAPYLLRPLGADKLRDVITAPARRAGVSFGSPETVDELIRSALSSDGSLPLLQFTLAELWEARDRDTGVIRGEALRQLGGMEGALERHADRVVRQLPAHQLGLARRVLCRLVTAQRTRAALGETELGTLGPDGHATLEALIAGRLLVAHGGEAGALYELIHEALIARWSTLRGWLDEDAERHRHRHRLAAAAADWQRLDRRGEALWRGQQLAGSEALAAAELAPAERAFLAASRGARRRARLAWAAVPLLAALAIGGAIADSRHRAHLAIASAVARNLETARTVDAEARAADAEAQRLRTDALHQFDQAAGLLPGGALENSWPQAEAAWARVLEVSSDASSGYARANAALDAAYVIDPARGDVRDELARLIAARLALAEQLHQRELASELSGRLAGLLAAGAEPSLQRSSQAVLSVHAVPAGAALTIARFESDASGRAILGPPVPLAAEMTLAPGSYLVAASAPDRAPVRLPLLLRRGQHQTVTLALPPAPAVPPGFVYIPAGESLTGSDEENLRVALAVAPMHPLAIDAFLIGRYEVTFAGYIDWLDRLPPDEQARRTPRNRSRPGAVELRLGADQLWTLALQPVTREYVAAWGQSISYPDRTVRKTADWRRFPVTGVSFEDAEAYARWLDQTGRVPGARMCREEEWERAARGADGRIYTTGHALSPSDANFDLTYGARELAFGPDEVGSHPESASVFGVDDLEGNAAEMVRTTRWNEVTVLRAYSWYRERIEQRLDNRFRSAPAVRSVEIGFRICADPAH